MRHALPIELCAQFGRLRQGFAGAQFFQQRGAVDVPVRKFEPGSNQLVELPEQRLGDRPSQREIEAALEREGQEILKAVPADAYLVALCVEGKQMPSEGMAELIAARENSGKPKLCFVIGGSFGLSPTVKARADRKLSMSQMTFPHHLARVMLVEQVYRGFKINEGSQYHK